MRKDYVAHIRDGLSAARRAAVRNYDTALCLRPVRRLQGVVAPGFLSRRVRGLFDFWTRHESAEAGGSTPPRWQMVVVEARGPTCPARDRSVAQRQRACGMPCPFRLCLRPARYSDGDCPPRVFRRAGARALPFEKQRQKGIQYETGCQRFHRGEVARGVP